MQKADIFVVVNGERKGISIKKGVKNSVHTEPISEFVKFLIENKIPQNIILEYLKYQYADGTTDGTGKVRLPVNEYKKENQNKIDEINKYFNKNDILLKAVNRFVLQGRNSDDKIDAIIYGVIEDFIWIKSDDVRKIIFKKKNEYSSGVHFSVLSCQPLDRCLNNNRKYDKKRFYIQLKWYNLCDNIIECINDKCLSHRYFN